SVVETTSGTSSTSGPGNSARGVSTQASADVTIIYHYIPNNCLKPGMYTVVQTVQPAGLSDGKESSNGAVFPNSAAGPHSTPVSLAPGQPGAPHNDFGELPPSASLAGNVYYDANNNGLRDDGANSGIGGVTVVLTGTDDLGNAVSTSTTTAADGSYSFGGLRP